MGSASNADMAYQTPTTPPSPLEEDGSVLVEHSQSGDLFSVTEHRGDDAELFFENRETRDTFKGTERDLKKWYDPFDL